jgi:hypothetical protein
MISYGHLSDFLKIGFSLSYTFFSRNLLFPCDKFIDYYRTNASFKIHYRNNLIGKKDSYLISCPPSYSYGHQLYPSEWPGCSRRVPCNIRSLVMSGNLSFVAHYKNTKGMVRCNRGTDIVMLVFFIDSEFLYNIKANVSNKAWLLFNLNKIRCLLNLPF